MAPIKAAVYPNPFNGSTTLSFNTELGGDYHLVIYSLEGLHRLTGNQVSIHKQDLSTGVSLPYLINTRTGERTLIEKLVVG